MKLRVSSLVREEWREHHNTWKDCTRCEIGRIAHKHVFARGQVPCEVLFVGEAPGKTEDLLGYPFIGKSGKLLDKWIDAAQSVLSSGHDMGGDSPERQRLLGSGQSPGLPRGFTFSVTNTCLCRPCDGVGAKNRAPTGAESSNCYPRLEYFVSVIAKPKVIVTLGRPAAVAMKYFLQPRCELYHPSYVNTYKGGPDSPVSLEQQEKLCRFVETYLQ